MSTQTAHGQPSAGKQFAKYVSQNILGMLGISAYILADTFFIAKAEGTSGITALNLVLPLYNLIFAIGSMMGVGSATRFRIYRAQKEKKADDYFPMPYFCVYLWQHFHSGRNLCTGKTAGAAGRRCGNRKSGNHIYQDLPAVCTAVYAELHLQCFCAQ